MHIQSNYPRDTGRIVTPDEIAKLRRTAKIGAVAIIVFTACATFLDMFPRFDENERRWFATGVLVLSIIASVIITMVCTMIWVTRAHRAVCKLRGITPRVPSGLLGFLSAVPYVLFSLPLAYTLEFLVIRSESPDTPTMRWYSFFSKSNILNLFAVTMIVDATSNCYSLVRVFILNRHSDKTVSVMQILLAICFIIAVATGIRIAKIVMDNIERLSVQN